MKKGNKLSLFTREGFSKLAEGVQVIIVDWSRKREIGEGVITSKLDESGKSKHGRTYTKGLDYEVLLQESYVNHWQPGYYGYREVELRPNYYKMDQKRRLAR